MLFCHIEPSSAGNAAHGRNSDWPQAGPPHSMGLASVKARRISGRSCRRRAPNIQRGLRTPGLGDPGVRIRFCGSFRISASRRRADARDMACRGNGPTDRANIPEGRFAHPRGKDRNSRPDRGHVRTGGTLHRVRGTGRRRIRRPPVRHAPEFRSAERQPAQHSPSTSMPLRAARLEEF